MADQRIEKWQYWINGTIKNSVLTMYLHRDAWLEVAAMLEANGQLPESYWWEFMRDTYATTQAIAVRRQADTHKDVASLGKLIEEIRDDPSRITREFWLAEWTSEDKFLRMEAERGWTTHYAGTVGDHLDPLIPAADFDALQAASADVRAYVDQHVAHAERPPRAPSQVTLTLSDIHDDIDVIGDLFKKYHNLLTASSYVFLVPVIQHDWLAIFREPWMRPAGNTMAGD